MPKVGKKSFPYSKAGKKAAEAERAGIKMPAKKAMMAKMKRAR